MMMKIRAMGLQPHDRVRVLTRKQLVRKYPKSSEPENLVELPGPMAFTRDMVPLCGAAATVTTAEDECQSVSVCFDNEYLDRGYNTPFGVGPGCGLTSWMFTKIKREHRHGRSSRRS